MLFTFLLDSEFFVFGDYLLLELFWRFLLFINPGIFDNYILLHVLPAAILDTPQVTIWTLMLRTMGRASNWTVNLLGTIGAACLHGLGLPCCLVNIVE